MSDAERQALDRVAREARAEEAPEHDWDRIEQAVLEGVDDGRAPRWPAPASERSWLPVAAAAAALLAVGTGGWLVAQGEADSDRTTSEPTAVRAPAPIAGSTLSVGSSVDAEVDPVIVEHEGVATWTLGPGGEARVAAVGDLLTVELVRGWIHADVIPSQRPESFAIEAGQRRVAVRGTSFRVELSDGEIEVKVTEGTVGVGDTTDRGDTRRWLLHAPAARTFPVGEITDTKTEAQRTETATEDPKPEPAGARPAEALPAAPPADELERATGKVLVAIDRCFQEHTEASDEMHVMASSNVTVTFSPRGAVDRIDLNPPLAPSVQECMRSSVGSISVPRSRDGAKTRRSLSLRR